MPISDEGAEGLALVIVLTIVLGLPAIMIFGYLQTHVFVNPDHLDKNVSAQIVKQAFNRYGDLDLNIRSRQ